MFEQSLTDILGHFHRIHDKLDKYITKTQIKYTQKSEQASALNRECIQHTEDIQKAAAVQKNIKALLGE